MKTALISIAALTIFPFYGDAQVASQTKTASNAETFSSKSGLLLKKEFIDVGGISGCEVQVAHFTDMNSSNVKISSVCLNYDKKSAFLDADEIDGLLKSLKVIKEIINSAPNTYTEVIYRSRGGFSAGCIYTSNWLIFMKLKEFDNSTYVIVNKEDISSWETTFTKAKSML